MHLIIDEEFKVAGKHELHLQGHFWAMFHWLLIFFSGPQKMNSPKSTISVRTELTLLLNMLQIHGLE